MIRMNLDKTPEKVEDHPSLKTIRMMIHNFFFNHTNA